VRAHGLAHVLALVVDRRIEPEFIDDVAALRGAAGDPDRATTFDLGDLETVAPTAPEAAETTTVSPSLGSPTSSRPK
jgi:hypothetical protein